MTDREFICGLLLHSGYMVRGLAAVAHDPDMVAFVVELSLQIMDRTSNFHSFKNVRVSYPRPLLEPSSSVAADSRL